MCYFTVVIATLVIRQGVIPLMLWLELQNIESEENSAVPEAQPILTNDLP